MDVLDLYEFGEWLVVNLFCFELFEDVDLSFVLDLEESCMYLNDIVIDFVFYFDFVILNISFEDLSKYLVFKENKCREVELYLLEVEQGYVFVKIVKVNLKVNFFKLVVMYKLINLVKEFEQKLNRLLFIVF